MSSFRYKARTGRGDLLEGALEAHDSSAAAAQLVNGGLTPILIEPEAATGSGAERFWTMPLRRQRPPEMPELVLFCRQMYTLTRSGVPVDRGIKALAESTDNPMLVQVLEVIKGDVESGRELSGALAAHPNVFSPLFTNMVRVGENTGHLDEAFLRVGQYLRLEWETRERIKAAMRYPAFVIVAISVALVVINLFVIPAFAGVFERAAVELPLPTRVLIAVSDFFVSYGVHLGAALGVAAVGLIRYVRTSDGRYRWDKLKLRLPISGPITARATLGRFARSFSLASRAGVPLLQTLDLVARALDNEFIAERILQMRNGIERGDSLARTAAATGMFTPLVLQMISIGEETGAVDELLEEVAEFYEKEVDADLKNLSAAIEPILLTALGAMVLVLALGVFLPMWDLAAGAGR